MKQMKFVTELKKRLAVTLAAAMLLVPMQNTSIYAEGDWSYDETSRTLTISSEFSDASDMWNETEFKTAFTHAEKMIFEDNFSTGLWSDRFKNIKDDTGKQHLKEIVFEQDVRLGQYGFSDNKALEKIVFKGNLNIVAGSESLCQFSGCNNLELIKFTKDGGVFDARDYYRGDYRFSGVGIPEAAINCKDTLLPDLMTNSWNLTRENLAAALNITTDEIDDKTFSGYQSVCSEVKKVYDELNDSLKEKAVDICKRTWERSCYVYLTKPCELVYPENFNITSSNYFALKYGSYKGDDGIMGYFKDTAPEYLFLKNLKDAMGNSLYPYVDDNGMYSESELPMIEAGAASCEFMTSESNVLNKYSGYEIDYEGIIIDGEVPEGSLADGDYSVFLGRKFQIDGNDIVPCWCEEQEMDCGCKEIKLEKLTFNVKNGKVQYIDATDINSEYSDYVKFPEGRYQMLEPPHTNLYTLTIPADMTTALESDGYTALEGKLNVSAGDLDSNRCVSVKAEATPFTCIDKGVNGTINYTVKYKNEDSTLNKDYPSSGLKWDAEDAAGEGTPVTIGIDVNHDSFFDAPDGIYEGSIKWTAKLEKIELS